MRVVRSGVRSSCSARSIWSEPECCCAGGALRWFPSHMGRRVVGALVWQRRWPCPWRVQEDRAVANPAVPGHFSGGGRVALAHRCVLGGAGHGCVEEAGEGRGRKLWGAGFVPVRRCPGAGSGRAARAACFSLQVPGRLFCSGGRRRWPLLLSGFLWSVLCGGRAGLGSSGFGVRRPRGAGRSGNLGSPQLQENGAACERARAPRPPCGGRGVVVRTGVAQQGPCGAGSASAFADGVAGLGGSALHLLQGLALGFGDEFPHEQ